MYPYPTDTRTRSTGHKSKCSAAEPRRAACIPLLYNELKSMIDGELPSHWDSMSGTAGWACDLATSSQCIYAQFTEGVTTGQGERPLCTGVEGIHAHLTVLWAGALK